MWPQLLFATSEASTVKSRSLVVGRDGVAVKLLELALTLFFANSIVNAAAQGFGGVI